MYSITPAHRGGRTRRALLATAMSAAAAFGLPAAAEAGTASVVDAGASLVAGYSAADGEVNNVRVTVANNRLVFADSAPVAARNGCTLNAAGDAECPIGVGSVIVQLGDRNDTVQYRAPHQASVVGAQGQDVFHGALRQAAPGRSVEPAFYFGGPERDTISYVFADRGVRVDTTDRGAVDGRPGIDFESVEDDFEIIEGSNFGDTLLGSDLNELLRGLNGDDALGGRGGADVFDEGPAPNGADSISGGIGANDRVFYSVRTSGVNVSLDSERNDGATGEQDNVVSDVEQIGGTNFRDVLTGSSLANAIEGFGGPDTIEGLAGNDTLAVGAGNNRVSGGTGNDVIEARNGQVDNIDCGENSGDSDTANREAIEDSVIGCERGTIGVLGLASKTVTAEAGETARIQLSWRHPKAWKQLKTIELRLLTGTGLAVGEVTIRPRAQSISAAGAVKVVPKHSRLVRKGKTVNARLALQLDRSLAGQTLDVDVEATDRRGRRQLERDAGRIRVAG